MESRATAETMVASGQTRETRARTGRTPLTAVGTVQMTRSTSRSSDGVSAILAGSMLEKNRGARVKCMGIVHLHLMFRRAVERQVPKVFLAVQV